VKASRREASTAVEASQSGILKFDSQGKIFLANAFAVKLFGFTSDELLGQPIAALLPERLRDLYSAHRGKVVSGSEAGALDPGGELIARRNAVSKFAVEIGLSMIHTDEGELTLCSVSISPSGGGQASSLRRIRLDALFAKQEAS
jgi:PAS domain S-box-containing protein